MKIAQRLFIPILILTVCFNALAGNTIQPKVHQLNIDGGSISYYTIGHGHPVLMLHGLFANKEQWLNFISQFKTLKPKQFSHYQFIIPDLAGFGQSTGFPMSAYNLNSIDHDLSQVTILHDFLNKLGITKKINLIGNSMGGLIIVLYAQQYPNEINTLAFAGSPEGITDFTHTFYMQGIRQGFNPFIPTTLSQFKTELKLLLVNYKKILPTDEIINKKILPNYIQHYQKLSLIYLMVTAKYYRTYLTKQINLNNPIIIFWGSDDHIFGPLNHAYQLAAKFKSIAEKNVIPINQAGHLILLKNNEVLDTIVNQYCQYLEKHN